MIVESLVNRNGEVVMLMRRNIEAERAGMQMTKAELSKALGIAPKTYQCYVRGDRAIPSDKLLEMADLFDCTTDYLLGRSNEKDAS